MFCLMTKFFQNERILILEQDSDVFDDEIESKGLSKYINLKLSINFTTLCSAAAPADSILTIFDIFK